MLSPFATLDSVAPNEKRRPGRGGVDLGLPGTRQNLEYGKLQRGAIAGDCQ